MTPALTPKQRAEMREAAEAAKRKEQRAKLPMPVECDCDELIALMAENDALREAARAAVKVLGWYAKAGFRHGDAALANLKSALGDDK